MMRILKVFGLLLGMSVLTFAIMAPIKFVELYFGNIPAAILCLVVIVVISWIWVGPTCKHDWIRRGDMLLDLGKNKAIFYECSQCRKKKTEFV